MAKRITKTIEMVDGKETVTEQEMDITAPEGQVVLRGGNASADGIEYVSEADGLVFVMAEHADQLVQDHGFERV
jgi:cell division ATPase FtsA